MSWVDDPMDGTERALQRALAEARARTGDEISRRRVWSRIAQPELFDPAPRRWPLRAFVTTLVVASAVALVVVRPFGGSSGQGEVTVASAPTVAPLAIAPAAPVVDLGALLTAPARVATTSGERRRVRLRGGARLTVAPSSVLTVDAGERPRVQEGEVLLEVPKQPPNQQFTVAAGAYVIVVVGTKFKVSVQSERVGVAVEEGLVEVWRGQERVAVPAGVNWASLAGPAPAGGEPDVDSVSGAIPAAARPSRRPAVARTGPPVPTPSRPALASAGPSSRAAGGLAPSVPESPAPAVSASASAPVVVAPAAPPPSPVEAMPAPRAPSDRFREAQGALAAGEPDRAVKILGSLAQGQGPAAENAAYEEGRVLRDHLLRPREAVRAWARYRGRFPRGILAPEAHLSILETLVTLGDEEGALVEAESFLRRYPSSERRAEVGQVAERLRRVERVGKAPQAPARP